MAASHASMTFRLYEAIRWGHDDHPDGADGPDTIFLVHATSHEQAAALADARLIHLSHTRVAHFTQRVHELGIDTGTSKPEDHDAQVLRGPCYEFAYCHGWRSWERPTPNGPWTETDAGNGSDGISRVIGASRATSRDP